VCATFISVYQRQKVWLWVATLWLRFGCGSAAIIIVTMLTSMTTAHTGLEVIKLRTIYGSRL
jgi:hypothetical protein